MSGLYLRLTGLPPPEAVRAPLLERVLARASQVGNVTDWRADAFGRVAGAQRPMPAIAPAALRAECGVIDAGAVYIATPVHCEAGMVSVRLPPDGVVMLDADTAGRLATQFNAEFAAAGQRLIAGTSGRLYCVLATPLRAATRDPLDVRGRDIGEFQPGGADGARLRRFASEIEMWLHAHAINAQRAAGGQPTITGLWLWGGGEPLAQLPPLDGWTAGSDPLFGAWPVQSSFPAAPRAGVVVVDAVPGDPGWPAAQATWLEPALAALRAGRVARLDVSLGAQSFVLHPRWSWRLWRRPRPWWEYVV